MMDEALVKELIGRALEARNCAYAPYSHFEVGAALLTGGGRIYTGCNIENAAYTPTCCAERTAFFKAVSEGERFFRAIAITAGPNAEAAPCGVCRQVMAEFCDIDEFIVITATSLDSYSVYTLGELLPRAFGPAALTAP